MLHPRTQTVEAELQTAPQTVLQTALQTMQLYRVLQNLNRQRLPSLWS
jgi:hypothetical protein